MSPVQDICPEVQDIGGSVKDIVATTVATEARTVSREEFARLVAEGQELRREFDRQTAHLRAWQSTNDGGNAGEHLAARIGRRTRDAGQ